MLVRPGEHVIGRLVPVAGGVMFESQPLPVPRHVAHAVAERPADWLQTLRAALASDKDEIFTVSRHRDSVVSDVPPLLWQGALLDDDVLPDDPDDDGFTVPLARAVLDAGARELREAEVGDDPDFWPCLGAALLEPYVVAALPDVVRAADLETFERLGRLLAEPAATLCREAAQVLFNAA
jgi:hypothetical protein